MNQQLPRGVTLPGAPRPPVLAPSTAAAVPHWNLLTMSPLQLCLDSSPSSTQPSTTSWRCTMATASTPVSSAPCPAPTQVPRARPALAMVGGWGIPGRLKGKRPYKRGYRWNPTALCLSCAAAVSATTVGSWPPYWKRALETALAPSCVYTTPKGWSIPCCLIFSPNMFV